ncbi:extensin [Puntigrus tetrazona]|uniref:extensin n=1 Tax=Puntigrus tetrazona TaxID=1606681 RepID=UPI001C89BFAF|nr:extensin [Puntigrus tetrazona]
MNTCSRLPILFVLLLAFHGALCSRHASKPAPSKLMFPEEMSNGDVFKSFWRNSKRRRSVKSRETRQLKASEEMRTNKPQYECGDRVLTVVLKHGDGAYIRVNGPHGNKLSLDRLAAFCGVSIKTTNTDVRLLFNYDSCYVKQESSKHVLSLDWHGTDVDLSCPVSLTPPSMICKNQAMELTVVDGTADELLVALNGEWAPLLYVATQCWQRELSKQGVLTFSVPYTSCGLTIGEGRYDLDLRLKQKMIKLSCPYEQIPSFPVKDSGPSVSNQPLPQREPNTYHKPQNGFPTKAVSSQVGKKEQAFPVEQPERNAAKSPPLNRRNPSLPKLPSLPGSFNLAVNFPFSLPMPTRNAPRDYLASKPVALSPEPTSALTPNPTDSSSEFSSSVQNQQPPVSYEKQEEIAAQVTKAPKPEYLYRRYHSKFEKPAPTSPQTKPAAAPEYPLSRGLFSSSALYQTDWSAQNFPKPDPLQEDPVLANLAQYIPPGYFLCSYNNQQPPIDPHRFRLPDPNQQLEYQKPSYQKPDTSPLAPVNPPVPPMKGYLQQQLLAGAVASSPYDSGSPLFQPTPYFQTSPYQQQLYASGYGSQGKPINLQPQTRPYPTFQDSRPLQPQYYQKPGQSLGSVQQPWSNSPFFDKELTEQSRPFMSASDQTPEYLQYQTSRDQSIDPYRRSVFSASVTDVSSPPQYMPSQLSTFPYSMRPEKPSADVFAENTRSSPKEYFQPRARSSVLFPRAPKTGNRPIISLPPVHLPSQYKSEAQVAQLPQSQGPSLG